MEMINVINNSNNPLPKYESEGAAGLDLRASFKYITPETPLKVWGDCEIIFANENRKALLRIEPGSRALIPTDLFVSIPKGHFAAIYPRSGLSIKKGLTLSNAVGVIDSGYRGEIKFKFKPTLSYMDFGATKDIHGFNKESDTFDFVGIAGDIQKDSVKASLYEIGDRIGQIIIMPYPNISFEEVDELSSTDRGDGGFGSTGV